MSEEWVETTLGEVAECSWGNTALTKKAFVKSGDIAFSASGPDGFVREGEMNGEAVVLSAIGARCGGTWYASGKWTAIKNTIWFRSKLPTVLSHFLYYLTADMATFPKRGQAQPFIGLGDVRTHPILLPPLPVQRRIVDLMTHLDAHIANLQAERSASVALQAAARVTLTAPNEEWLQVTIGEVADFAGGYAFPERFQGRSEGTVPFFKVSDMNRRGSEKYLLSAANYVDHETLRLMKAKAWPKGTIVFPKVGAALKTEKRRLLTMESAFDNNCLGLVPREMVTSEFLFARMCAVRLSEFAQEGAVPSVNQAHVASIPIWLPSLSEQEVVGEVLNSIDHAVASIEVEIDRLNRVRKTILSGLMSREKQVDARYDALLAEAS